MLHFGNKEQLLNKFKYNINGQYLNESVVEKDLGVFVSSDLNLDFKTKDLIRKLYTTLIRPKLEYANVIWFPSSKKHVLMLEKVQRRCTKIGPLRGLPYTKRLEELCLTTLEVRRIRGDLISMFRYFKGFDKINFLNPPKLSSSRTRGHIFKLEKESIAHNSRRKFLFSRATNEWNSLPKNVINSNTVVEFKKFIDSQGIFKVNKYHYNSSC